MTAAWAGFAATGHPGWEPDGGEIRVWGTPDGAVASGPWRDSDAVRALWGAYSYRPARS